VLIKSLLVVVYFYAGVAKFNEDWLRAEPLRKWLVIPYKYELLLACLLLLHTRMRRYSSSRQ